MAGLTIKRSLLKDFFDSIGKGCEQGLFRGRGRARLVSRRGQTSKEWNAIGLTDSGD